MHLRESYHLALAKTKGARDDIRLRLLLGRWVSELEPTVVWSVRGDLVGLAWLGDPKGEVIVHVER